MDNEYADYASFSTVVLDYELSLVKAANALLLNWGYDPESCLQETFTFYED